jgi:hypothetical protein
VKNSSWILACLLCACSSWQQLELSPPERTESAALGRVQVVRTDSTRLELDSARLVGDSLVGVAAGASAGDDPPRTMGVALSQVNQAAVREPDPLRTAGLVALVLALLALVVFGVAFRQALVLWYEELADIG